MAKTVLERLSHYRKNLVFVGMMGSGKSAIGKLVASKIGVPFADTDVEVENIERIPIVELFKERGEEYFRDQETQVLRNLLSGPPRLVALGGGGFLSDRNRQIIRSRGVSVWLSADAGLLWSRVKDKTHRPLLQTMDPYATLVDMLARRTPFYEMADLRVQAQDGLSKEEMAQKVADAISVYLLQHSFSNAKGAGHA